MGAMTSQITSLTIVYSTVYSGADQRKHQSSASLAFVRELHKGPVTWKMFPFDDVIMDNPRRSHDKYSTCRLVGVSERIKIIRSRVPAVIFLTYRRTRRLIGHNPFKSTDHRVDICLELFGLSGNFFIQIDLTRFSRAIILRKSMVASCHGNTFRITGPVWGNPPVTNSWANSPAAVDLRRLNVYSNAKQVSTKQRICSIFILYVTAHR